MTMLMRREAGLGAAGGDPPIALPNFEGVTTELWLNAKRSDTITLNGSRIVSIADANGNGRIAQQTNDTFRPDLNPTGLSGFPAIDSFVRPSLLDCLLRITIQLNTCTLAVAWSLVPASGTQLFDIRNTSNGNPLLDSNNNSGFGIRTRNTNGSNLTGASIDRVNNATQIALYNINATNLVMRLNGVERLNLSVAADVAINNFRLFDNGADGPPTGNQCPAFMGEFILYRPMLTPEQAAALEGYLTTEWPA